ncbi:Histone acetyltransferase [Dirofilaria immitis]|nr:Histone acetyltransferase [Dirofilaria immitis]
MQEELVLIDGLRTGKVSADCKSRTTITSHSRSSVDSALYEREYITTRQHRYLRRNGIINEETQSNSNDQLALGEVCMVLRHGSARRRRAVIIDKRLAERGTENEYYVHYEGTDRRLDEWAQRSQIQKVVQRNVSIEKDDEGKKSANTSVDNNRSTVTRVRKRKHIETSESLNPHSSVEDEKTALEKEHEEVTKVKHIERIRYGNYEIDTWYFSPYPDDYGKAHNLYICQYCIEIYKEKSMSVYEVLGSNDKVYCQCLCLLAKLFLDHKTLYFDVEPFLFYVLCEVDSRGAQMVGYFSKEQGNPDGNNLACICILPPFQRSGYGKFLIQLSYEISKREGLIGSPEKPLSDLGKLSYRSYWSWALLEVLRTCSKISITDLSRRTAIHVNDIIETLHSLKLTRYWKGDHVLYVTQRFLIQCWKTGVAKKPRLLLRPRLLRWQPR